MAFGFGLLGMEKSDVFEVGLEFLNELRGECDFGDEKNDRLVFFESLTGEL